jgi:putative nucleotidyltransferase with HDIG domain
MEREEALELMKKHVSNKNLRKHCLAVEAGMRVLARKLGENEGKWALVGLLHDLDYDETKDNPEKHGFITMELLADKRLEDDILYAIKAHPGHFERKSLMDKALYALDPLTGLIVAAALMHPSKKLNQVDSTFVLRRFNEKSFARGANREEIKTCEEMGIPLEEFVQVCLEGMQKISEDLGL